MKLFFFLIYVGFFLQLSPLASEKLVTVGAVHYPPYYDFESSKGDDGPRGFLVKHIQDSLEKNGFEVKWLRIPLTRGAKALKKDDIQVYGSYAPFPGDKAPVVYSKTPLVKMQPIICGLRSSLKDLNKITEQDITGQETLFPQGAYVHPKMKELKLKIERLDYTGDYISRSIKMIQKKRAKFFILPESLRVRPYLKKNEDLRCSNFIDVIAMHLSFAQGSPWIENISPLVEEYPAQISIE
jgi:hypothetical protein